MVWTPGRSVSTSELLNFLSKVNEVNSGNELIKVLRELTNGIYRYTADCSQRLQVLVLHWNFKMVWFTSIDGSPFAFALHDFGANRMLSVKSKEQEVSIPCVSFFHLKKLVLTKPRNGRNYSFSITWTDLQQKLVDRFKSDDHVRAVLVGCMISFHYQGRWTCALQTLVPDWPIKLYQEIQFNVPVDYDILTCLADPYLTEDNRLFFDCNGKCAIVDSLTKTGVYHLESIPPPQTRKPFEESSECLMPYLYGFGDILKGDQSDYSRTTEIDELIDHLIRNGKKGGNVFKILKLMKSCFPGNRLDLSEVAYHMSGGEDTVLPGQVVKNSKKSTERRIEGDVIVVEKGEGLYWSSRLHGTAVNGGMEVELLMIKAGLEKESNVSQRIKQKRVNHKEKRIKQKRVNHEEKRINGLSEVASYILGKKYVPLDSFDETTFHVPDNEDVWNDEVAIANTLAALISMRFGLAQGFRSFASLSKDFSVSIRKEKTKPFMKADIYLPVLNVFVDSRRQHMNMLTDSFFLFLICLVLLLFRSGFLSLHNLHAIQLVILFLFKVLLFILKGYISVDVRHPLLDSLIGFNVPFLICLLLLLFRLELFTTTLFIALFVLVFALFFISRGNVNTIKRIHFKCLKRISQYMKPRFQIVGNDIEGRYNIVIHNNPFAPPRRDGYVQVFGNHGSYLEYFRSRAQPTWKLISRPITFFSAWKNLAGKSTKVTNVNIEELRRKVENLNISEGARSYLESLIGSIPTIANAVQNEETSERRNTTNLLELYESSGLLMIPLKYSDDFAKVTDIFRDSSSPFGHCGEIMLETREGEKYILRAFGQLTPTGASIVMSLCPAYQQILDQFMPHMSSLNNCLLNSLRGSSVSGEPCYVTFNSAWLNFLEKPMDFIKHHGRGTNGEYLVCGFIQEILPTWSRRNRETEQAKRKGLLHIWPRKNEETDLANQSIGTMYVDDDRALKWVLPAKVSFVNDERNVKTDLKVSVPIPAILSLRGVGGRSAKWTRVEDYSTEEQKRISCTAIITGLEQFNCIGKDVCDFQTHLGYKKISKALMMKSFHLVGEKLGLYNAIVGPVPPMEQFTLTYDNGVTIQQLCYPKTSVTTKQFIQEDLRSNLEEQGLVLVASDEQNRVVALLQFQETNKDSEFLNCQKFNCPESPIIYEPADVESDDCPRGEIQ